MTSRPFFTKIVFLISAVLLTNAEAKPARKVDLQPRLQSGYQVILPRAHSESYQIGRIAMPEAPKKGYVLSHVSFGQVISYRIIPEASFQQMERQILAMRPVKKSFCRNELTWTQWTPQQVKKTTACVAEGSSGKSYEAFLSTAQSLLRMPAATFD